MGIGVPEDETLRPTFVFKDSHEVDGPVDDEGFAFSIEATPTIIPGVRVQVLCAYETTQRQGVSMEFSRVTETMLAITLLDEEYEQVAGFEYVLIGDDRFNYDREDVPYGLGGVTVHTIRCIAQDDS